MAASGSSGGGARSPAAAASRELVDNLLDVRDRAARLQTILQASPTLPSPSGDAGELVYGMMTNLSNALSALDTGGDVGRRGLGGGRRKKGGAAAAGGPHRRTSSCRRRSKSPFVRTVTAKVLEDGKSWRKYGQKHIQNSPNPRSYFRCTHRPDQGCMATRQVQLSGDNPPEFVISYYGEHTCRDPSTIPLIIEAAPMEDGANLINFGSAPASTSTATHPLMIRPAIDPAAPLSGSLASEEALSSSSRAGKLAGVVRSAGRTTAPTTVGSAPAEFWLADMAGGGGTGSFPSSPSSLGFMTGSFGSFGNAGDLDDIDMFGFDP